MKMNHFASVILLLAGCSKPIQIIVDQGGLPVLHVQKGQVIQWMDHKGGKQTVTFPLKPPCVELEGTANHDTDICTTNSFEGYVPYICKDCADPGYDVGSKQLMLEATSAARIPSSNTYAIASVQPGAVYCDSNTTKVYPDQLIAPKTTGSNKSVVEWKIAAGETISTFTIQLASGTCETSDKLTESSYACTLKPSAVSQSYTISNACSTNGIATLTIQ